MHIVARTDNQSKKTAAFNDRTLQIRISDYVLCDFASVSMFIYCRLSHLLQISLVILGLGETTKYGGR
jgi:hypothetical protein